MLLDAEVKLGDLLKQIPKATPNNNPFHEIDTAVELAKPKKEVIQNLGFSQKQAERYESRNKGGTMKVFQMNGKPNHLEFTNYERLDEEFLFQQIIETLKGNPDISIGQKVTGPSEDLYDCEINGNAFTLIYDLNYGTSIYSENEDAIQNLSEYFNN